MEILCPNCQRKLTIMEQYAGQMMKCPLCSGTFTAPALPSGPLTPVTPPPSSAPPPPPAPAQTGTTPETAASQLLVPTEHTGRFSLWISPRYTQYVPAAALFLVFILSFFPWFGIYPGGVPVDWQNAWQVTFGTASTDKDLEKQHSFVFRDDGTPKEGERKVRPGFGVLMLFYLLALLVNLFLAMVVVAVGFVHKFLPAIVQKYLAWRWPALALVTLGTFGFLLLQDAVGFSLERSATESIDRTFRRMEEERDRQLKAGKLTESQSALEFKEHEIYRGIALQQLVRTSWFRWAFWLHFWALVFVIVTMLAELRTPRPAPRVDLLW